MMSQQRYEVAQGKPGQAFCFSGDFAKTREAKSEEKEAFLSEFLGSPHGPDLGLNHRVFVAAQCLHRGKKSKYWTGWGQP